MVDFSLAVILRCWHATILHRRRGWFCMAGYRAAIFMYVDEIADREFPASLEPDAIISCD
ncbi:unnamed protein product [Sphenostylis stenocarpa]|uniref:Uncharacterized protein n=1 Tax=Sphenostylis stenocarpa TaxID=92480 RepID=A0AA86W4H7_9FABA|nr:unnamed protein product [Sphenostylis stenocarpa]